MYIQVYIDRDISVITLICRSLVPLLPSLYYLILASSATSAGYATSSMGAKSAGYATSAGGATSAMSASAAAAGQQQSSMYIYSNNMILQQWVDLLYSLLQRAKRYMDTLTCTTNSTTYNDNSNTNNGHSSDRYNLIMRATDKISHTIDTLLTIFSEVTSHTGYFSLLYTQYKYNAYSLTHPILCIYKEFLRLCIQYSILDGHNYDPSSSDITVFLNEPELYGQIYDHFTIFR